MARLTIFQCLHNHSKEFLPCTGHDKNMPWVNPILFRGLSKPYTVIQDTRWTHTNIDTIHILLSKSLFWQHHAKERQSYQVLSDTERKKYLERERGTSTVSSLHHLHYANLLYIQFYSLSASPTMSSMLIEMQPCLLKYS